MHIIRVQFHRADCATVRLGELEQRVHIIRGVFAGALHLSKRADCSYYMLWQLRLQPVVWTKLWHNHGWLRRLQ